MMKIQYIQRINEWLTKVTCMIYLKIELYVKWMLKNGEYIRGILIGYKKNFQIKNLKEVVNGGGQKWVYVLINLKR